MPAHPRPTPPSTNSAPSGYAPASQPRPGYPPGVPSYGAADIRAIMTTVEQLGQNLQYFRNDQKRLANTIISYGGRLKSLADDIQAIKSGSGAGGTVQVESVTNELNALKTDLIGLRQSINELSDRLSQLSDHFASREDLAEIKYVVNAINPLEYATVKQVELLVERKVKEALEKSAKK